MITRRNVLLSLAGASACLTPPFRMVAHAQAVREPEPWAAKLIAAAESQIGTTVTYDPAYARIAYPNGDVPRERGVCTDVVVRAYRDALGLDLQRLVHEDMARAFRAYPRIWGLARPDRNIDHRRVPNLATFFTRHNAALAVSERGEDYRPGDIVTQFLPGRLAHIGIVTHRDGTIGARPMMVHNIGAGTRFEDVLFAFEITGHFRYRPASAV
jgi:hypothetical protein